ncbi:hypothetical protein DFS34DRAFT_305095 [Phlyctochytrium arcticum]|nr:hypothetical protein DFS34DRAFT_305095 [Phlyctochytrium arcticum]
MASAPFASHVRGRLDQLSQILTPSDFASGSLSVEALLDVFLALYTDCKAASSQVGNLTEFVRKYDKVTARLQTLRINTADFDIVKTLATGAVGKVCLVKYKPTKKVYAMKILKKSDLLTRQEAGFFMEERDALVFAKASEWITTLYAAFQDEENLYLVMEYASGGSLRSLLNNREEAMSEDEARFYIAQILLALDELHQHNFIHRDVKPENCLIDAAGHVKLADFGSCIRMNEARAATSHQTVGTPDYISPEILRAHEGNSSYGRECDWWSLGIILYELLFDEVPFYSESLMETYGKIMDHEKHFAFPEDEVVSPEAFDFMSKLICKKESRLGRDSSQEIQKHPWFKGFSWESVRTRKPPFVPELSGPDDTRYFEDEDNESKKVQKKPIAKTKEFTGQQLPFVGYSYVQDTLPSVSWQMAFAVGGLNGNGPADPLGLIGKRSSSRSLSGTGELDSTRQQMHELLSAKQAAEDEAKNLRVQLASAKTRETDLNNKVTLLEKKREMVETDLKSLRSTHEGHSKERESLQISILKLKQSLDDELGHKSDMESAVEARARMERELEVLRTQLKQLGDELKQQAATAAEAASRRDTLENDLQRANRRLQEEKTAREAASKRAQSAEEDLQRKTKSESELAIAKMQLEQRSKHLELELESMKLMQTAQAAEAAQLASLNLQIEQGRASAEAEVQRLSAEKSVLEIEVGDLRSRQQQTVSNQGELIGQLQRQFKEASSKIGDLTKMTAGSSIEVNDLRKRVQTETAAHNATKEKLTQAQNQVQEQQQRMIALTQEGDNESKRIAADLKRETTARADAERALAKLEDKLSQMSRELETSKFELQKQLRSAQHAINYEQLYFEAQSSIEELHKQLTEVKTALKAASDRNNSLKSELEIARGAIDSAVRDMEREKSRYNNLQVEFDSLEERTKADRQFRVVLESENASLRSTVKLSEEKVLQGSMRLEELDQEHAQLAQAKEEAEVQCSLLHTKIQNLVERVHELEQTCAVLHSQIDHHDETASRTSDTRSVKSPDKSGTTTPPFPSGTTPRSKGGWRNVLFRSTSSTQQLKQDHSRAGSATPVSPAEDDSTKILEYGLQRRLSAASSSFSLKSATTKSSDMLGSVHHDFNHREGLRGWIKMPKGGKVKKGWKPRYAVVRDSKIFLYDRDKDVGITEGQLLVDIRSDIFIVKVVAQNELIHANGKDIDCILKIHAVNLDATGQPMHSRSGMQIESGTEHNDVSTVQKKISKLDGEIALEEKMLQAAEKMWSLSNDQNRGTLTNQIDASQARLRGLKLEQERYRSLLPVEEGGAAASSLEQISESVEEDVGQLKKRLESLVADEERKREGLLKVSTATAVEKTASEKSSGKSSGTRTKATEQEIAAVDRNITRIKGI